MMRRLHFIRHGTTEGNKRRIYYGRSDLPLIPEGEQLIRQNADAGKYPQPDNCELFTSGMLRAEQTFELIYGQLPHEALPDLREIDFGDFEMFTHEELLLQESYQAFLKSNAADRPPNGEHPADFTRRVTACAMHLLQEHIGDAVVVCHGGVIGVLMAQLFPHIENNFFTWQPPPGGGYTLLVQDGVPAGFEEI